MTSGMKIHTRGSSASIYLLRDSELRAETQSVCAHMERMCIDWDPIHTDPVPNLEIWQIKIVRLSAYYIVNGPIINRIIEMIT